MKNSIKNKIFNWISKCKIEEFRRELNFKKNKTKKSKILWFKMVNDGVIVIITKSHYSEWLK